MSYSSPDFPLNSQIVQAIVWQPRMAEQHYNRGCVCVEAKARHGMSMRGDVSSSLDSSNNAIKSPAKRAKDIMNIPFHFVPPHCSSSTGKGIKAEALLCIVS